MNQYPIDILLVEDNPTDAELTMWELSQNNMSKNLLHLADGEQALEYIFQKESSFPKLILLDIKMPKVDGIEVLKQIKSNEYTKGIPVVIMTSSREDPDIKKCYSLGANSYIVKPVNFEAFSATIKSLGLYWLVLNQVSNR
jgi:two-component system response regulator